jgi:hypothetical protein
MHLMHGVALRVLLTASRAAAAFAAEPSAQGAPVAEVQSALLLNFARYTEWPEARRTGALMACVVADERLAGSLTGAAGAQDNNGRPLQVRRVRPGDGITDCHVLFISKAAEGNAAALLAAAGALPVLTVSDREGFGLNGGIIEVFVDNARMGFAVNIRSAQRSGLNLSSGLLHLAKAVYGASAGV